MLARSASTLAARALRPARVAASLPAAQRSMTWLTRHSFADDRVGIGYLQLQHEEVNAELELVNLLPEFKEAMDILHGDNDQYKPLPNAKKAALAVPKLERTVDICRSSMGDKSLYLLAALHHLCMTQYAVGNYDAANKAMLERGDAMDWPTVEQERILRLFLRENQPKLGLEWCQKGVFTSLFPQDATMPIKWSMYELIAKTLQDGTSEFHVQDPMFSRAVEVLRAQKSEIDKQGGFADETLRSHEIPHLMSQYAALSLVASHALVKDAHELNAQQQASLEQAEALWRESLEWVEKHVDHDVEVDELATGVDGSFEAWVQTNLGELLLRTKRTDEAMEFLGKALKTQQSHKGGNALALSRVLSKIAHGCHVNGQAVSSEGLFTTVLDSFEKEAHLSLTDQVEYALALRSYGALLKDWDKREKDAVRQVAKAAEIERSIAAQCKSHECKAALHPVFYLPL